MFSQERKDLSFIHYSTIEGLSSNEVSEGIQDNMGFIWIGTEDGLNRFDGYNFKVYRKKINDSTSLSDNYISALFVDSRGDLWVGTQKGLNLYNKDFDSFVNFYPFDDDFTSQSNNVAAIAEDNEGRVYTCLEHGIYRFNSETRLFEEIIKLKPEVRYLFFDSSNLLWVLTDENIYLYNNKMEMIETIINPLAKYPYKCMIEDDDKFWIATIGSGMFWFDKQSRKITRTFQHDIYENYINTIYKDKQNNIWIGSLSNLKLYDRENDRFHYYYYNEIDKNGYSSPGIRSFFQDNENNYWILTAKGGVNVSLVKKQFINLTSNPGSKLQLNKKAISSVLRDSEDRIWAGSYNSGINIIDFQKQKVNILEHDPSNKSSISANSVLMLFEDSKKNIWVGTYRGGLQKFNKNTGDFKTFRNNPKNEFSISSDDIRSIAEDKEGNLWLATAGKGLDKFDRKTDKFYHYSQDLNNIENTLINNWLYNLLFDSEGNLWIGSSFGLSMFNYNQEEFTNYFNDPTDSNSLSNNFINYIFEDSKKNLWIGTNEGLNRFNKKTKTFRTYFTGDGLPNSVIKGILEDESGNLWISTNKGISKFNPKKETFRNYDIHDGLASNEFSSGACSKNKKGLLFFGCNNGIVSFYPDSIRDVLGIPAVFITGLKLYNKQVIVGEENSPLKKDILQTKELILKHNQAAVITFDFVSISYIQSDRKQYVYMMDGFDKDWVYSGTKREATYTNLDPGEYTFRVKASNHDNLWNEEGASIKITILPPWWQTIWFRILAAFILIGSLISFYLNKTNTLQKQKHKLEKLVKERTKEIEEKNKSLTILNATKDKMFSIIAHDLKNPFNSILGFSQLLENRYNKLDENKKKKYIKSISYSSKTVYRLLDNLLQWASSQSGVVQFNPKEFFLLEVVTGNIDLVNTLFIEKKIIIHSNISKNITVYADKNMISTVFRNLLSNAIKFMEKGEINISAIQMDTFVKVSVQDTGIGMSKKQQETIFYIGGSKSTTGTRGETGTGLGLIICKDFIEKNNGKIWVESELNKQTTFYITIPAGNRIKTDRSDKP